MKKNTPFNQALKALGLSQQTLAKEIGAGRTHLSMVLSNRPGRGGQTRRKIVAYLDRRFPEQAEALVALVGWDRYGRPLDATGRPKLFHATQN